MNNTYPNNNGWHVAVSISSFLFFALSMSVPSGYSYGSGLLLLISLTFLAKRPTLTLSREDKILIYVLIAVFVVSLFAMLIHGDKPKTIDQTSRCLVAIPILLLILKVPPRLCFVWSGLAIGSIASAGIALWQLYWLGAERPSGFVTSAIPFGGLSLMMGMLCFVGIAWANTQRRHVWLWRAFLSMGFLAGLYSSLASGSRGGWLAIPFVFCLVCIAFLNKRNLKQTALNILILFIALATLFSVLSDEIKYRYELAVTEVSQFAETGQSNTSIGARLAAWEIAINGIQEKPILGWSIKDYDARLKKLAKENRVDVFVSELANTHNNYVEVWLHQGVLGLLALLVLFIYPFWSFCKRLRTDNIHVKICAVAGASLVASFAIFSLTQVILGRNNGIVFFLLTLIIFWGTMRNAENQAKVQQ